jgi:hypothetical protein
MFVVNIVSSYPGPSLFPIHTNVLTTYHGANEIGACELPADSYATTYGVALGDISSLQSLKFNGNLCGHVLQIDCGYGAVNMIVVNANLGGGLDLYASTWNKVTNNKSPGQQFCRIQLTNNNALITSGFKCYYATGETNNNYYRNVGLINTGGKITTSASINGKYGTGNKFNLYYAFNFYTSNTDVVTFYFNDGSSYKVALNNCASGSNKKYWN